MNIEKLQLSCALVACDDNGLYIDFWPYVKKTWNNIVGIPVKLIFISEEIPEIYKNDSDIILFKPSWFNKPIHTAFIAQCIRLLYPALMKEYDGGIIISDMDMIPMNKIFYHDNIKTIDKNKFVNYTNYIVVLENEYPMCYNIATCDVWSDIFSVNNVKDIVDTLENLYDSITYTGIPGDIGWNIDQRYLFNKVNYWNKKTNRLILLNGSTGFVRLDRGASDITNLSDYKKKLIKDHYFADYHMLRPYNLYKTINDEILDLVLSKN